MIPHRGRREGQQCLTTPRLSHSKHPRLPVVKRAISPERARAGWAVAENQPPKTILVAICTAVSEVAGYGAAGREIWRLVAWAQQKRACSCTKATIYLRVASGAAYSGTQRRGRGPPGRGLGVSSGHSQAPARDTTRNGQRSTYREGTPAGRTVYTCAVGLNASGGKGAGLRFFYVFFERDNAAAVLVVLIWKMRGWWRRLASGAWEDRLAARLSLPPSALAAHPENEEKCFFGIAFSSPHLALQIAPRRNETLRKQVH